MPELDVTIVSEGPPPISEALQYGSSAHARLRDMVMTRVRASANELAPRVAQWDEVDRYHRLYADRRKTKDKATAQAWDLTDPRSVIIPASYAALEVRLVQELDVLTQRDPLIELGPGGPEDLEKARVMEQVLAYDLRANRATLLLWTLLQTGERYGVAPAFVSWEIEEGEKILPPLGPESLPLPAPLSNALWSALLRVRPELNEPRREWGILRELNRIQPLDPSTTWLDPDYSVNDMEHMSWCGHRTTISWLDLAKEVDSDDPVYFNLEAAKKLLKQSKSYDDGTSPRWRRPSSTGGVTNHPGTGSLDHMVIRLIPADVGLGVETRPQLWVFEVVNGEIIVRAHAMEDAHQRMPYMVFSPNAEPWEWLGWGTAEATLGLQKLMDWLVSAYLAFARRRIKNAMVVVPELIKLEDLLGFNPGGVIRTSELGSQMILNGEMPLGNIFQPLEMPSSTGDFEQDAQYAFHWLQTLTAASDPQMARPLPTKRTLGELQQVAASGASRIMRVVKLFEEQLLVPLSEMMISNRRQWTTTDLAIKIAGTEADAWRTVGQRDMYGNYDYVPIVGMRQNDPMRMAQVWMQVLQTAGQIPPLVDPQQSPDGRVLDVRKVFEQFVREAGIRNFDQLLTQPMPTAPQVMPDEQLQQQVQAGNVVPIPQGQPTAPPPMQPPQVQQGV